MSFMVQLPKRGLKSTFSKYSFGREGVGHKKEYSVYALDNGRPLTLVSYARLTDRPFAIIVKIKSEKECDVSTRFYGPRSRIDL